MNKTHLYLAILLAGIVSGLILYDRHASDQELSSEDSDKTVMFDGLDKDAISEFVYHLPGSLQDEDGQYQADTDTNKKSAMKDGLMVTVQKVRQKADLADQMDADVDDDKRSSQQKYDDGSQKTQQSGSFSWRVISPVKFKANFNKITSLLSSFLDYRYDEVFDVTAERMSEFGLSMDRSVRVEFKSASADEKYKMFDVMVGADAPVGMKMYLSSSIMSDKVFFGPKASALSEKLKLEDFLDLSVEKFSFDPGSSLAISLKSELESKDAKTSKTMVNDEDSRVLFEELFVYNELKAVSDTDTDTDTDADVDAVEVPKKDITLTKSDLQEFPDSFVSHQAVEDFLSEVSKIKLLNVVLDTQRDKMIKRGSKVISLSLFSQNAFNDSKNDSKIDLYKTEDKYFAGVDGYLFLFDRPELYRFFDMSIADFLSKPVPFYAKKKLLTAMDVVSYPVKTLMDKNDDSSAADADSDADDKSDKPSEALTVAYKKNDQGKMVRDVAVALSGTNPLLDDLDEFVDELFMMYYVDYNSDLTSYTNPVKHFDLMLKFSDDDEQKWSVFAPEDLLTSGDQGVALQKSGDDKYYHFPADLIAYLKKPMSENEMMDLNKELIDSDPDLNSLMPNLSPHTDIPDDQDAE